jgi:hypothetical protein
MLRRVALYYAAASLGGLAVALTAWALGQIGVADALGVAIKPPLEPPWLYRLIVWGGIWGLIFLLPLAIRPLWLKALLFTLAPVLVALVVFFPMQGGGLFALDKGALAPFYVYLINIPWGLLTAYLGRALGAEQRG